MVDDQEMPECHVCGAVYGHDPECGNRARRELVNTLAAYRAAEQKIAQLEEAEEAARLVPQVEPRAALLIDGPKSEIITLRKAMRRQKLDTGLRHGIWVENQPRRFDGGTDYLNLSITLDTLVDQTREALLSGELKGDPRRV